VFMSLLQLNVPVQGSRLRPNGRILRLKLDIVRVNFSSTRACATSKLADFFYFY